MTTAKNKYPVPLIADLFDCLSEVIVFSRLNLHWRYWQAHIAEGDESKTIMVTRYKSFEFLVIPFDLTNTLVTFCNLMNNIFHNMINHFLVIYLDDIVVYSRDMAQHVQHLRVIF